MSELSFYKGKRVLITGHTGFKGSWMCRVLLNEGAELCGYSLKPPTDPALFDICGISKEMRSVIGDIRDYGALKKAFEEFRPELVLHLAAQPIVRTSYREPRATYEINVMGTVNVLECCRATDSVQSIINVTTDKVYRNDERNEAFREEDYLDGFDPYSNSKSCSELVSSAYRSSFLQQMEIPISTCRAGNVIGGGDFATDRIIPDCYRAISAHQPIVVRNPYSIRPYQHVLEPVTAYLKIAAAQYEEYSLSGSYNIGPDDADCIKTGELVERFCIKWERHTGGRPVWIDRYDGGPHEASFLRLDNTKARQMLHICPVWNIDLALDMTAEWYAAFQTDPSSSGRCMDAQIEQFLKK